MTEQFTRYISRALARKYMKPENDLLSHSLIRARERKISSATKRNFSGEISGNETNDIITAWSLLLNTRKERIKVSRFFLRSFDTQYQEILIEFRFGRTPSHDRSALVMLTSYHSERVKNLLLCIDSAGYTVSMCTRIYRVFRYDRARNDFSRKNVEQNLLTRGFIFPRKSNLKSVH